MPTINGQVGSIYTQETSTEYGQARQGDDYKPWVSNDETYPEIGAPQKTSLRDRIAYPFRAIKNRMLNSAVLGALVGGALSISVPVLVGAVVGSVAGGAMKLAKMVYGYDSSALPVGAAIGVLTGLLVSSVVAIPLIAVSAVAFSVISLVGSSICLPRDIHRAVTLDQSDLKVAFQEGLSNMRIVQNEVSRAHKGLIEDW